MIKKTKIVATIGPASWDKKILNKMIENGLDVARINASFADHDELKRVGKRIRNLSKEVALMMDTKGHKIRLSKFKTNRKVKEGKKIKIYTKPKKNRIHLVSESEMDLSDQIPKDSVLLIDDGSISLEVEKVGKDHVVCKVMQEGTIKSGKTVNIPSVHIDFPDLSEKDYNNILSAIELDYDFISMSYIRNTNDVEAVKKIVDSSPIKLIAKIEDWEGVNNFDEILEVVDGVMIARGDLGVELPPEKVPPLQEQFIRKCNRVGKPVIVATQMLQSMTENRNPTRAEVNDVADAISDGADAIMLSAETSIGKYPAEAVGMMRKIALEIEKFVESKNMNASINAKPTTNAIAESVIDSCNSLPIDKIVVATGSGTTAKTIARFMPKQPIFAFAKSLQAKRWLSLSRGIIADVLDDSSQSRDTGVKALVQIAKDKGYVSDTDLIIVVAGANILQQGATNMMEINRVDHIINST